MTLTKKVQFKAALIRSLGYTHVKNFDTAVAQQRLYETWINTWIDTLYQKSIATKVAIEQLHDMRRQLYLQITSY